AYTTRVPVTDYVPAGPPAPPRARRTAATAWARRWPPGRRGARGPPRAAAQMPRCAPPGRTPHPHVEPRRSASTTPRTGSWVRGAARVIRRGHRLLHARVAVGRPPHRAGARAAGAAVAVPLVPVALVATRERPHRPLPPPARGVTPV